ncbi:MAG TPA: zf-HC2 domain-containing protein [Bryobacteraceae bacterium]|nr:zf-HC2 domain-containing protein [Bryobacteraceae bacterium]
MSCSIDLKAYVVGEVAQRDRAAVEDHVRACQSCREELDRLNLTRSALATLEDEEPPRRIAFVSDRVFEPRWWQTMWHSGPAMGFASAVLLAAAILVHGFERPVASTPVAQVDTAQIQSSVDAAVAKAVSDAQAKQAAEFAKVLNASETRLERQRQSDLATVQQAADYYRKQLARFEVASNEGPAQ